MGLKYGCDDKQQGFVFSPKLLFCEVFCLCQHLSSKPHSDGNEIGVAEALGVVEHGDDCRNDAEDSNILGCWHRHWQFGMLRILLREQSQDLFRFDVVVHSLRVCRHGQAGDRHQVRRVMIDS